MSLWDIRLQALLTESKMEIAIYGLYIADYGRSLSIDIDIEINTNDTVFADKIASSAGRMEPKNSYMFYIKKTMSYPYQSILTLKCM